MSVNGMSTVVTQASTNLNRILRVTANLLFEKNEDPANVVKLLSGFVAPAMIQAWYTKYCQVNGIESSVNFSQRRKARRMPMPPIDWKAVDIKTLDEMTSKGDVDDTPEPDW